MKQNFILSILIGLNVVVGFNCQDENLDKIKNSRTDTEQIDENKLAEQLASISANTVAQNNSYDDLETWEAPYQIRENYPYYLSGYDTEGRPIFIEEFGKWDFRKIVEAGDLKMLEAFDKYVDQVFYRVSKIVNESGTLDEPSDGAIIIMDLEKFSIRQLYHIPTATYIIQMAKRCQKAISDKIHVGLGLNTHAVAHTLLSFIRPHFGGIFEKMEVYGTNRARWIPHVLKHCPKDQIPEWYGGTKNFRPVKVFG